MYKSSTDVQCIYIHVRVHYIYVPLAIFLFEYALLPHNEHVLVSIGEVIKH